MLKSFASNHEINLPVFTFENGKFLTLKKMNKFIVFFLQATIGNEAKNYSCKSFRAALPSALAALPALGNKVAIKRWGRWTSKAFEKYTRLNHKAKKAIFRKFCDAILESM